MGWQGARRIAAALATLGCALAAPAAASATPALWTYGSSSVVDTPSAVPVELLVSNEGNSTAANVQLQFTVPDGATYVSTTPSTGCSQLNGTVTCSLGSIPANDSATRTVTFSVPTPTTFTPYVGNVSVSTSTSGDDPSDNSNDTYSYVVPPGSTNLYAYAYDWQHPNSYIEAGGTGQSTVTVVNEGPNPATGAILSIALPAGTSLAGATGASCSQSGGNMLCTLGTIAAGDVLQIVATLNGPASVPGFPYVSGEGSISYLNDYLPDDDWTYWSFRVVPNGSADLRLRKTNTAPSAVEQGSVATVDYGYRVFNDGPNDATGVAVSVALPTNLTYVSTSAGAGIACLFSSSTRTVTCSLPDVASGAQSNAFTVSVQPSSTIGSASTVASASLAQTDFNPANNSITRTVQVVAAGSADMKVWPYLGVSGDPQPPGGSFTFDAYVGNGGPAEASGARVAVALPAGAGYVDGQSSPECSLAAGTVTCAPTAPLAVGDWYGATIALTAPQQSGAYNLHVTAASNQSDWLTTNNDSDVGFLVADGTAVDVTGGVYASPLDESVSEIRSGQPFTMQLVGDLDWRSRPASPFTYSVETNLPPGLTFTSPTPSDASTTASCSIIGSHASCSWIAAPGEQYVFGWATLSVIADAPGTYQLNSLASASVPQWAGNASDTMQSTLVVYPGTSLDQCTNLVGFQTAAPAGYVPNADRTCSAPPPTTDRCPNLGGDQGDVPTGYGIDGLGNCSKGTTGDDSITGSEGKDHLEGGAGDDRLDGGGGNDMLFGGEGLDTLLGGFGIDILDGGAGNDRLFGDAGNDSLRGGAGNDRLDGGTGNDALNGGSGNDREYGGAGNDRAMGGTGNDLLDGGIGTDTLTGGAGNDRESGGVGNDTLSGGAGRDTLNGGAGSDQIDARDRRGGDRVTCGAGNDTARIDAGDVAASDCERVRAA